MRSRTARYFVSSLLIVAASACDEGPTEPATGYVRVFVQTNGGDPDDAFDIIAESVARSVSANVPLVFPLLEGQHLVRVEGIAANCILTTEGSINAEVSKNDTTRVNFHVSCAETGVRIETRSTGVDIPGTYLVTVPPQAPFAIGANTSWPLSRLAPGSYQVRMSVGANAHCSLTGDSIVTVNVINRQMATVAFDFRCSGLPRNGTIVFVEGSRLAVIHPDGSGMGTLNDGYNPSWSRDGTKIVYSNTYCDYYSYACSGSLAIVDPLTRQITSLNAAEFGIYPDWSPTDDVIAYIDASRGGLWLYNVSSATSAKVALDPGILWIYHPSWSPDGKQIVASCNGVLGAAICLFNRDGTGLKYLTSGNGPYDFDPSWSPDGTRIAFSRSTNGPSSVHVINADGTGLRTVIAGSHATWSPDSRELVFAGNQGLFIVREDGANLRRLTTGVHFSPVWKP